MTSRRTIASTLACFMLASPQTQCYAFGVNNCNSMSQSKSKESTSTSSRRSFLDTSVATLFSTAIVGATAVLPASAATDCFSDCLKNCKLIAPKDPAYCQGQCQDYCDQPDRTDGLSGSVSSTGGEVGMLGFNTVVKGEDKPPGGTKIPGLDFTSDTGKKLLGY